MPNRMMTWAPRDVSSPRWKQLSTKSTNQPLPLLCGRTFDLPLPPKTMRPIEKRDCFDSFVRQHDAFGMW